MELVKAKKEKSCGAIVFTRDKDIKYLLLHYESGHWGFPKGHVEKGESEEETMGRELEEETGLRNVRLIKGFKEEILYFFKEKKKLIKKRVVFFLVESKSDKVKLSYEHVGFKWLPYESALKQLTYENTKNLLRKAHKFLTKESLVTF